MRLRGLVLAGTAVAAMAAAPNPWYATYHFDGARTGWNPNEAVLSVATVARGRFRRLRTFATDSVVYAQPLYAPQIVVRGKPHDLAILASEGDVVYAYDADTGALVWRRALADPARGLTAVSPASVGGCGQITPTIGISSTPVIDPATQTLYVVDKLASSRGGTTTYRNRLVALRLRDGTNAVAPRTIAGSVPLQHGGRATFVDRWQQNRLGLVLSHGTVYAGFGSSCDERPAIVHGWLFAYDARTLAPRGVFATTATAASSYLGALWSSTYAPPVDASGALYLSVGNGAFDANAGGRDYGESVLKVSAALAPLDYFAPYDEAALSDADQDVGSTGAMLVPGGGTPRLLVAGAKSGTLYLIDRDRMGGFSPTRDRVLQELQLSHGYSSLFGGPAYYPGFVYWGGGGEPLRAYALTRSPSPRLRPSSATRNAFEGGGTIPAVSSDGTARGTAIVWATTRPQRGGTIELYAYDATDLARTLWSGPVGEWRASGNAFLTPTVAHGHVFVPGAGDGVAEFGLSGATARGTTRG